MSLTQSPTRAQHAHARRASETPIYVPGRSHPIGRVVGDTFLKSIVGSRHLLRRPPAIAFDISTLHDAQEAGARRVAVIDTETGTRYEALIDQVLTNGFRVVRGFGNQIALPLSAWHHSAPAEPKPSIEELVRLTTPQPKLEQLSLFEEAV